MVHRWLFRPVTGSEGPSLGLHVLPDMLEADNVPSPVGLQCVRHHVRSGEVETGPKKDRCGRWIPS